MLLFKYDMFTNSLPLIYSAVKSGDAELLVDKNLNLVNLSVNGIVWMGLDLNNLWQAEEFVIELSQAKGYCITSGLGLGILQSLLSLNPAVSKIRVYEKNKNVIDIFRQIAEKNQFDISKIEIVNGDADNIDNLICDCLFLDHFENESENEIINRVKSISEKNKAEFVWYWPAANHLLKFCLDQQIDLNQNSYRQWKEFTGIKNLPNDLSENYLEKIVRLGNIYKNTAGYSKLGKSLINIETRNNLKKLLNKKV